MLKLRAALVVTGDCGPPIIQRIILICALVYHRFYGEDMTRSHDAEIFRRVEVEHVGCGMEDLSNPMTEEVLGSGEPVICHVGVYHLPDLVVRHAWAADGDGCLPAVVRDLQQLLCVVIDFSHTEHLAVVPVVPADVAGDIDVDDVSVDKLPVGVGNPVANHLVEGRTHTLGKPPVVERRRIRSPLDRLSINHLVYLCSAHACLNRLSCSIKNLSRYPSCLPRTFHLFWRVLVNDPGEHRGNSFRAAILSVVWSFDMIWNMVRFILRRPSQETIKKS
mmetsp:Transcript_12639/g.29080  ORF Transcript_12639/g.29080 Transcript_12639/m.29080 type:complete len:277 (-) Transcript_12639:104-934(-)